MQCTLNSNKTLTDSRTFRERKGTLRNLVHDLQNFDHLSAAA